MMINNIKKKWWLSLFLPLTFCICFVTYGNEQEKIKQMEVILERLNWLLEDFEEMVDECYDDAKEDMESMVYAVKREAQAMYMPVPMDLLVRITEDYDRARKECKKWEKKYDRQHDRISDLEEDIEEERISVDDAISRLRSELEDLAQ